MFRSVTETTRATTDVAHSGRLGINLYSTQRTHLLFTPSDYPSSSEVLRKERARLQKVTVDSLQSDILTLQADGSVVVSDLPVIVVLVLRRFLAQ